MKKFFIILLLPILLFYSCNKQRKNVTLKFLETTDVHGSIFPYDFINNKVSTTSIAQVSSFIKQERQKKNQSVVLLDNGDILQGQPTVYYSNFIDTLDKHICAKTMNYLKYDAATVGNHDIEPGHKVYDRIRKEFKFPWLSANTWDLKKNRPYFQPYKIIVKNGVKIAILGLTTPGIPNWLPPDIYSGMEFRDMIKSAKLWMKVIKRKENPDIIVGLFHAGHDYTYGGEDANTHRNENATMLVAKQVPGFDFIFCGHDHDKFMQQIVNNVGDSVWIIDPKAHAEYIGTATINLTWNDKKQLYEKSIKPEIIGVKGLPIDTAFMHKFAPEYKKIKNYVSSPIAHLNRVLDGRKVLFGDNAFMDLIHKTQLDLTHADVSLTAPLSMRAVIDTGVITTSQMFKLYRFENLLYTMRMTGQEIKDFLEYSYGLWINQVKPDFKHFLLFDDKGKRLKNPYFNFDSAEGIKYTVDVTKPEGNRITIIDFTDGRKFDLTKNYRVAVNSYRGNGGGGHLTKGAGIPKDSIQGRILKSTQKDLRFYMMQYLKAKKSINPTVNGNWSFIPKNKIISLMKKDSLLLYGNRN